MSQHDTPSDNDRALMQQIERQDQTALAQLYTRYGKAVYSLTYRVLRNTTLAEEATQDVFLKVWRQASRWDASKGQLLSWLLTIARYAAIDRLRQEKRQTALSETLLDESLPLASEIGIPDDPLLRDGQTLRTLMQHLPPEQAQAIDMAFFQGLTHTELAERLRLPLGTVKARIRMGIRKLRFHWYEQHPNEKS